MLKINDIEKWANLFLGLKEIPDLANYLEMPIYALEFISENVRYNIFYVNKPNGGQRRIEDPEDLLKSVQQKLNRGFQSVYYLCRSAAAYGFQWSVPFENNPRNIKTNAERHLRRPWMFNADFEDFFYQVTSEKLFELLISQPFKFNQNIAEILVKICTLNDRLPMGAATSPVLSNIASIKLDRDLIVFATENHLAYTRYVDDLTFSSLQEISEFQEISIVQIAEINGFKFNQSKFKHFGPNDTKIVTGLVVNNELSLPKDFLTEIELDIQKYKHALELSYSAGINDNEYFKKFRQQLEGKLEFVKFIVGQNNDLYKTLKSRYRASCEVTQYDVIRWNDFTYYNFTKP